MITQSVDHVSFAIDDLEASLHFYRDILGFELLPRPEMGIGGAWLGAGSAQVHLIVRPEGMELGKNVGRNVPLANHTAFAIADYDKVHEHLQSHGLDVLATSREQGQMWVTDPSGNVIEFISTRR